MSDKHLDKDHGPSQAPSAADQLRADGRGDTHKDSHREPVQAHGGDQHHFSLKPALEAVDDTLGQIGKILPWVKDDGGLTGPGCFAVDMVHDKPSKTNQLLKDRPVDSYNCKYYVKTFMDGKEPGGDRGRHEELSAQDLTSRGYQKQDGRGFYKPGDIVLVLPNPGVRTLSPLVHCAVVTEAGPMGQGVMLTQKPDGEHPVTRTDLAAFCKAYGISSNQCHLEIYRQSKKPVLP